MPPETINERVAALEPQVCDLQKDVAEFRAFKDDMIKQVSDVIASVKNLSWKISLLTGLVMFVCNQLANWGFSKLLH